MIEDKRSYMRGLAEKKYQRLIDAEIKAADLIVASNLAKARQMAEYSGLTERECLGFIQYGRW